MQHPEHRDATLHAMWTTITLEHDVAKAIERLRRQRGIGLSQAVNELIREGLRTRPSRPPFRQRTSKLGLRIDVRNVAEALDLLEGPTTR
jgi:Ribbon-helix-helix protein, copG family